MEIELDHYPQVTFSELEPRDVCVWLPPQYTEQPDSRFPVIYMHDGQNLFNKHKWIKHTWQIAEIVTSLSRSGAIKPAVVVGIASTPNRVGDYYPAGILTTPASCDFLQKKFTEHQLGRVKLTADDYLQLIVKKIKPMIDQKYRTLPNQPDTFMMGSSMGGLITLYGLCQYPDVFCGGGCFSTHWPIVSEFIFPYLEKHIPDPGSHKIYFDHGSRGIDADYQPYQEQVDDLFRSKGYSDEFNYLSMSFPGAWHNELAWSKRLHFPLQFFLGNPS